jgi:hypothetical protein
MTKRNAGVSDVRQKPKFWPICGADPGPVSFPAAVVARFRPPKKRFPTR